jgi:AcrR family transcriptional regulator
VPGAGDGDAQAGDILGPLPGGHHGLSPEQVAESQHERLLAAVATLVAERGYRATTITEIAKTASVANRIFYKNFANKEEAFIAAFDTVAAHLRDLIVAAVADAGEDWSSQLIAALRTALNFFDSEPEVARLCLVAPFTATPDIVAHFRDAIATAVPHLAAGRQLHGGQEELPDSTEDSLIGGVISQLSRSLLNETGPLIALLPDLVEFGLSPYLGISEARRLAAESAS